MLLFCIKLLLCLCVYSTKSLDRKEVEKAYSIKSF